MRGKQRQWRCRKLDGSGGGSTDRLVVNMYVAVSYRYLSSRLTSKIRSPTPSPCVVLSAFRCREKFHRRVVGYQRAPLQGPLNRKPVTGGTLGQIVSHDCQVCCEVRPVFVVVFLLPSEWNECFPMSTNEFSCMIMSLDLARTRVHLKNDSARTTCLQCSIILRTIHFENRQQCAANTSILTTNYSSKCTLSNCEHAKFLQSTNKLKPDSKPIFPNLH